MKSKRLILIAAITVTVIGGLAVAGMAYAQDESPPGLNFLTTLAEKLGVSEDTMCSAVKETQLEGVNKRLEEGAIDEDQAAEMKAEIEESDCGIKPGRGPHPPVDQEELADFLGVTVDELEQAREDGKTLKDLAEENGISEDELKEFMQENAPAGPRGGFGEGEGLGFGAGSEDEE